MTRKIKVGLIFGGRSGEHEVSLISGWNIFKSLDKNKYSISLIGIDKNGDWHFGKDEDIWLNTESTGKAKLNIKKPIITAVKKKGKFFLIDLKNGKNLGSVDVFFPITHGMYGEDGCLQGFFETIGAPYVGPGVLGSAIGMDKDISKKLLRDAGFKIPNYQIIYKSDKVTDSRLNSIIEDLKLPVFVKPARQGSSVGVSRATDKKEIIKSISEAFKYDSKVVIEEAIIGREIECGVLGNLEVVVSNPGEISMQTGFYSYDAKYIDSETAKPIIGVKLPKAIEKKIKDYAVTIFKILECRGMSRVDFFLTAKNEIYVNEINTLPGFTNISMYPKMFEQSGITYGELLDKLIELALDGSK